MNKFKLFIGVFGSASIAYAIIYFGGNGTFVGPLTGAIIATGITLSFNNYQRLEEKEGNRKILINALIAELTVLNGFIEDNLKMLRDNNLQVCFHISEDYFTVFSQQASKLGLLPNNLSTMVIKAYIETKGLFDGVREHSELVKRLSIIEDDLHQTCAVHLSSSSEYEKISARHQKLIAECTIGSKYLVDERAPEIVIQIDQLIKKLNKLKD